MKISIIFFIALSLCFSSCQNSEEQISHDEHHDEVKLKITAYSNDFELFAEADPFVVGRTSEVLAHFSHLPNFHALEEGSMTIRLIVNGNDNNNTLEKPTRKGIYKFQIMPDVVGIGQLLFELKTKKGKYQIVVPNIQIFSDDHDAIHAAEKEVVSSTNATVFTKEQSWKIDFATDYPKLEPFGQIIKATAQVKSSQNDEILIASKTNGIVFLSAENIIEGIRVSNEQVLFTISGNDLSENNSSVRFIEAKNNFDKTKADYERLAELSKDKIISEKELLQAKHLYDNAKVIYDNLNKNFSVLGQKVISTKNGFIKKVFVKNGQYVEAGQPLVIVSQNKTLQLLAEVQQKYAHILSTINSANIRTFYSNQTYSLEELNGKIVSFGRNANEDNYLIPVNLVIDNKGDFISGGFVELYLKTISNYQALTIPNTSLLEEEGIYFVFVQVNPELFEKREVKLGKTDGLKTEVIKGISEKDRIVTIGAVMIKLAQATGTLDAHSGHNH